MESPDRTLRKNAFESLYAGFGAYKNSVAAMLCGQVKQLEFFSKARRYASPLEASLDATEVPVGVYHALIEAVHQNLDKLHRYMRLRKKLLGVDELHMYDLYTPLIETSQKRIPFDEAKKTVVQALGVMGERYGAILQEGFQNRWIDVYENTGKRSGAYSAGACACIRMCCSTTRERWTASLHWHRDGARDSFVPVQQDPAGRLRGLCDFRGRGRVIPATRRF